MKKSLDKERILSKLDQMNGYLEELEEIRPLDYKEYKLSIVTKRACERLLQLSIETMIDTCNIIVSNLKLGLPEDEDAVFNKLRKKDIISKKIETILINMKGFRNILVHKYGEVKDELVFENLEKLEDFDKFNEEIMKLLKKK